MKFLSRGCGKYLRPPAVSLTPLQYAYAKPMGRPHRLFPCRSAAAISRAGGMS